MKELNKKEDDAIGCSCGALLLMGITLLCLSSMFSFTSLFENKSTIYVLMVIMFVFGVILYMQHTSALDKVSNITFAYKNKENELAKNEEQRKKELNQLRLDYEIKNSKLEKDYILKEQRLHDILTAKSPFKYLASAYADAVALIFDESSKYLRKKSHPALTASEEVKRMKKEAKKCAADAKFYLYQYEFLLNCIPNVNEDIDSDGSLEIAKDYFAQTLDENEDYDRVQDYLSSNEYEQMTTDQRNQLALDRYMSRKKNNWQIGRDYEMYVCHWLRCQGYEVEHTGINGLQDLGRDIIAHKDGNDYIIQCKYWSKNKVIREKYIMQLYGTTIAYMIENNLLFKPSGVFITNIELSDTAKRFASLLNIKVVKRDMGTYPVIKCNINQGNKIYHLPFDQQYDRTKICLDGEFFATTVKEAVTAGFRRAFRHNFIQKRGEQ